MDKKSKVATFATGITALNTAMVISRDWKQKYDERNLYTASVSDNAYVYNNLMVWLNNQIHGRRVQLISKYSGVKRFYDGAGESKVIIDGQVLSVRLEKPDNNSISKSVFEGDISSAFSKNLVFRSRTKAGIDALENLLKRLTVEAKVNERQIHIYNPNSYGGWDGTEFAYRDLDSIFLPEGVKEGFLSDIDNFLTNEKRYVHIGIPWHRGYLLYGEPGNGKSSLVSAVANRYKFNLYNLPLSGVKNDKALAELVSRITANSVLLLEDIDIFSKSMSREQNETGPTLAGLLNALDGVNTPHGLITFITTNRKETLEPALLRPGRIDFNLELFAPVAYQVQNMFRHVYGEELGVNPKQFDSMAQLSNVFKVNISDPESARLAIKS